MNVTVTLTTIPSRLDLEKYKERGMYANIISLLNQNYDRYCIHINLPKVHKHTGKLYIIPPWLDELVQESNGKLKIFSDLQDLGPVTKIVPTVKRINNPDDIIIVVDDDLVYHKDMVKEQIKNQEIFNEAVVGYDGMRSRDRFFNDVRDYFFTSNYRSSRVDILQHYKSVSYKRSYFEDDFFNFIEENLTWHDDILLSAYFSKKKRDRIATFHPSDPQFNTLDEWRERGGVTTFPVLKHTAHDRDEGCNVFRSNNIDDNSKQLFKYIDNGY